MKERGNFDRQVRMRLGRKILPWLLTLCLTAPTFAEASVSASAGTKTEASVSASAGTDRAASGTDAEASVSAAAGTNAEASAGAAAGTDRASGAGDMKNYRPPTGGYVAPKVMTLPEDAREQLGVTDEAETAGASGADEAETAGASGTGVRVFSHASQAYASSWDRYSSNYIYNRLGAEQRDVWDEMDALCLRYLEGNADAKGVFLEGRLYYVMDKGISSGGLSSEELRDLFLLFSYANPQYYFIGPGMFRSMDAIYLVIYDGFADGSARRSATARFRSKARAMEAQVAAGKTDAEKARIAHDLIIRSVRYDYDYNTVLGNSIYHQSAYSVFCEGYSVCAGYAKAFEFLMNGAGVDAISVTSRTHAWNIVRLDNIWYQVDCTWDDTDGRYGGYGEVIYRYFIRSDEMMSRLDLGGTHQAEGYYAGLLPKCAVDSGSMETSAGNCAESKGQAAKPSLSQKKTGKGIKVSLRSATAGAEIYYTLDGKTPSASFSRSFRYKKPFLVTGNVTVKAVAVCSGKRDSKTRAAKVYGKMYTVKFNAMGGKKIPSKKVHARAAVQKPAKPKRPGYRFVAWYQDKKFRKKWNFDRKVTKNLTLYAKWKKVKK